MACGATGDALHLVAAARRLDIKSAFGEVLAAAAELGGVDLEAFRQTGTKPQTLEQSYYFRRICEVILEWTDLSQDAEASEYLRGRGLLEGAIADGWGVLPPAADARASLLRLLCKSFGDARVLDSGLACKDQGGRVRWLYEEARLCIPYRRGHVIRAIQRRACTKVQPTGCPKYIWAGARGIGYGEDSIGALPEAQVAFVEGAPDAVALTSLARGRGYQLAVVGVPGSAWGGLSKRLNVQGRRCLVATDNEPGLDDAGNLRAGERYVVDWAADLYAAGAESVARLRPLGAKDWGEIAEQLAGADEGGDLWEIEEIPRAVTPDAAWKKVAELAGAIAERGSAPELDLADVSRLEQALAEIKSRRAAKAAIEFVDRAELAVGVDFGDYPIKGLPMLPGPPTLFVAYSFSGKTIVLQDALLALALGERVWGEFDCKASRVVHLDYEQGKRETIDRYHRLLRGRYLPIGLIREIPIDVAIRPHTNLWSDAAADSYERAVDGAALCLIDTFGAASPNQDENDARIAEGLHLLTGVSERTGCTFVVAHHIGKAGAGAGGQGKGRQEPDPRTLARGHGAIFGAAGYCYHLGGKPREPKPVTSIKGRNLGDPPCEDFWLELSTVDVRDVNIERGWDGYRNPRNPGDHGGFAVSYMCAEEYEQRFGVGSNAGETKRDAAAIQAAVLAHIHKAASESNPVVGAESVAAALGISRAAAFSSIKRHLVGGAIKRSKLGGVNVYLPS
jgi:hypothetical protein